MGARGGHLSIRGRAKPKLQPGNILSSLILAWDFPKIRVPFWSSNSKDYSLLGSILGSP